MAYHALMVLNIIRMIDDYAHFYNKPCNRLRIFFIYNKMYQEHQNTNKKTITVIIFRVY
jgi:hypothetical protein